ncbi:MAG TPA: glycosyltransferase family 1 protein [Bryobacteraceae bacterium]|nr:glycosyltransferase family 1 protein [Bryobacteraceae bacterium]
MIAALDATPLTVPTGGVTRYTWELARALAAEYAEDQYWLLSDQPFAMPAPVAANLHKGEGPRTAAERRWWLWGLEREMMRRGAEVFHGTDFSVPYISRRPSVMTVHDLSPWLLKDASTRVRRRVPLLLRARIPTMVITPSEAVRRAVIARFRLDAERVAAVPLAASSHFRPVETPAPTRPYFLFVGTLEARKNITRLMEAWKEVRRSEDIDLVLAGRLRDDFAAPTPEEGLRILGAVPDEDLPVLYSGAAAFVYPSLYEGFGLPVLEAMQCGATVITSRDPAIMEVSGGAAVHIDPTDVRSLAEAMRARPVRREESLQRAAQFSWSKTAQKTREVYDVAARIFAK